MPNSRRACPRRIWRLRSHTAFHEGIRIAHSVQEQHQGRRLLMSNDNGHNTNGTGKSLVHANGNGHKPDAAIVDEHALLWDGLPPAVTQALEQPLNPALVSRRNGHGGKVYKIPRRPRRLRAGQPDLRPRRLGLRSDRRLEAAPDRDGRSRYRRGLRSPRPTVPGCGSSSPALCLVPIPASTPWSRRPSMDTTRRSRAP